MVQIAKPTGKEVATGYFKRASQFKQFKKGKRGRVGVLINIRGKDHWFNYYGTYEEVADTFANIEEEDKVRVEYNTRVYQTSDGEERKSRDIVAIKRVQGEKQERLSEQGDETHEQGERKEEKGSDTDAFMPNTVTLQTEYLEGVIVSIENEISSLRQTIRQAIKKQGEDL